MYIASSSIKAVWPIHPIKKLIQPEQKQTPNKNILSLSLSTCLKGWKIAFYKPIYKTSSFKQQTPKFDLQLYIIKTIRYDMRRDGIFLYAYSNSFILCQRYIAAMTNYRNAISFGNDYLKIIALFLFQKYTRSKNLSKCNIIL